MKKIILFFTLLFVGIYGNIFINIPTNAKTLISSKDFETSDVRILNSGYYLIFSQNTLISEEYFIGDYVYSIYYGSEIRPEDFGRIMEYDEKYFDAISEMCNDASKFDHPNYKELGITVLYVKSYAALVNNNELISQLTITYAQTGQTNTDSHISGGMTHIINAENMLSLDEIKSRYRATDNVDNDITSSIVFTSNYSSTSTLGKYYIMAQVTDRAGNKTTAIDYILVKDFTAPSISLTNSNISIEVHTTYTSEDAKKNFIFSDNYSKPEELQITFEDNYNNNFNTLGSYTITATAKDKDGNISNPATLTINIVDTTKPQISLKAGGDRIVSNHILTNEEILALLQVSDNYDQLSTSNINIINNTCTGQQGQEYIIQVQIADSSSNIGEATFKYYLTDTTSPIIIVEDTLYIEEGVDYTSEQLINMLKEAGIIADDATTVNFEYYLVEETENEKIYDLAITQTLPNGQIINSSIKLNFFTPVKQTINDSYNYNYLWFLLLLLPVVLSTYKILKKYEKN